MITNDFNTDVSTAVKDFIEQQPNGKYATTTAWIKALILLALYPALYFIILLQPMSNLARLAVCFGFGIVGLLIVFNIGHDAVHNAFSRHRWVNKLLGYSFNLVGSSAYSWKLKHNDAHHRFTNINHKDHDIEIDPFMRVSPSRPHYWVYRLQHIYWPFVYMLFSLLIIFIVDFAILFQERNKKYALGHPIMELVIMLFTKAFYIFYIFLVPVVLFDFSIQQVLVGFFSFHFLNGLIIGLVFQPSHYFMESHFMEDHTRLKMNWLEHQLKTTCDLSPNSALLSHTIGSLNVNVAHHAYPDFCHVHYPRLGKIIKEQCKKHGITYHSKSYLSGIKSHTQLIRRLSKPNVS